ncbi:hypothetical protein [Streptomyces zhihengii]|uniref:Uncharacterized protein n=1 Tax=Streptomyces zhihengii TaxID=1818004 RepID=A0ABS2V699_9ACTN|nr:hypothetical protein [Streptomyces zhihengii]MBM9624597.1 hypothetical protein [Streptomyces zhihengii]
MPSIESLQESEELWFLLRHLMDADNMLDTLEKWTGQAVILSNLHRQDIEIPEHLQEPLHAEPATPVQYRAVQFNSHDANDILYARSIVVIGRVPAETRTLLQSTHTPLGYALRRLHPRRHLIGWNIDLQEAGPSLTTTTRMDIQANPVVWMEERFSLAHLLRRDLHG